MPPEWNQRTPPAKMAVQSKSPRARRPPPRRPGCRTRAGRAPRSPGRYRPWRCSGRARRRARSAGRWGARRWRGSARRRARRSGSPPSPWRSQCAGRSSRQVRRHVVLAAANVDRRLTRLAEGHDAGVEAHRRHHRARGSRARHPSGWRDCGTSLLVLLLEVATEAEAHGREHLVAEVGLAARGEALVQRGWSGRAPARPRRWPRCSSSGPRPSRTRARRSRPDRGSGAAPGRSGRGARRR